jgi:hypothetical protein
MGRSLPKKEKKKRSFGSSSAQPFFGLSSAGPPQPIYFIIYQYNNILYIIINIKNKKFPNKIKNPLKKFVIFSHIFHQFCIISGLYIYTVRYKSNIKILGFLRNFFKNFQKLKKKLKNFKLISHLKNK